MNTVSNGWLRISPAFCMRVSDEYIAANRRAGRNNCRGSTMKVSAAAHSNKAALAHRNRSRFFAGLEPFPFGLNRNEAPACCSDAFSLREPEATSLENALAIRTGNR